MIDQIRNALKQLENVSVDERIDTINQIRQEIHKYSPFAAEPVDCVLWVKADDVAANDYNPNSVAPPEMKLLEHSIKQDGYTQPIVVWKNGGKYEVVDGFHRNRVGKESKAVRKRVLGRLPLTVVNDDRLDRGDRISATIRHNRARGKHKVDAMSDIVIELKRRNWSDDRICRELGMDQDEVLRLCQITGLAELFTDQEFSRSWDVEGEVTEADFKELSDDTDTYDPAEIKGFRTLNTDDPDRIFHTYHKWECFKAGFYNTVVEGKTKAQCEEEYRVFLSDVPRFKDALQHVTTEWKHSCEHYLTNSSMNRIAWLGQAAMCYATGIPCAFRGGFFLLTEQQQADANQAALEALNGWLAANGRKPVTMEAAYSGRQSNIY